MKKKSLVNKEQGLHTFSCGNINISGVARWLPWVPEPQNLNERKLVRGKERRKKGVSGQMITQPGFGADQRDYESIRSPFAQ